MADKLWDGIMVRGSLGETGTVPRGSSSASPDLIAYGTAPLQDPGLLQDEATYGNGYSNNIYLGQFNYLYMRGKNLHNGPIKGHWEFWAVPSNLLLLPGLWKDDQYTVRLATSDGNTAPEFEAKEQNQIVASLNAFSWNVKPLPGGRHYCLIGVAVTDLNPNPIDKTMRISDWGAILSQNANIAQRNTNLISGNVPDMSDIVPYDQGSEPSTVDLTFLLTNIPKGSTFRASSGTPLPGYGTISVTVDNTKEYDFKHGVPDLQIPGGWSTTFGWTLTFGSDWGDITGTPAVQLRGEIPMDSKHRYYHLGRLAPPHVVTGRPRLDAFGKPVRLLTVGSFQTVAIDKRNPSLRRG